MPHVRARCFQAVVLAAALTSMVVAPSAAAPAVSAGGSTVTAPAAAMRDVDYDVEVRNGPGTSRASGELTWTPEGVVNDGRLVNHGADRAVVTFHLSVLGAKDALRTFDTERDGSLPTDFTVLAERIVAIGIQVCNRRSEGRGRSYRCGDKHFGGWESWHVPADLPRGMAVSRRDSSPAERAGWVLSRDVDGTEAQSRPAQSACRRPVTGPEAGTAVSWPGRRRPGRG
jgi:hypothetical protein